MLAGSGEVPPRRRAAAAAVAATRPMGTVEAASVPLRRAAWESTLLSGPRRAKRPPSLFVRSWAALLPTQPTRDETRVRQASQCRHWCRLRCSERQNARLCLHCAAFESHAHVSAQRLRWRGGGWAVPRLSWHYWRPPLAARQQDHKRPRGRWRKHDPPVGPPRSLCEATRRLLLLLLLLPVRHRRRASPRPRRRPPRWMRSCPDHATHCCSRRQTRATRPQTARASPRPAGGDVDGAGGGDGKRRRMSAALAARASRPTAGWGPPSQREAQPCAHRTRVSVKASCPAARRRRVRTRCDCG